jgi:hypothetical protein
MKINAISGLPMRHPNFRGLWEKPELTQKTDLYGGEYTCDYYDRTYHPCLDETEDEIQHQMYKKEEEMNAEDSLDYLYLSSGSYISAVKGSKLPYTKSQLNAIFNDCKAILAHEMPEGPLNAIISKQQ